MAAECFASAAEAMEREFEPRVPCRRMETRPCIDLTADMRSWFRVEECPPRECARYEMPLPATGPVRIAPMVNEAGISREDVFGPEPCVWAGCGCGCHHPVMGIHYAHLVPCCERAGEPDPSPSVMAQAPVYPLSDERSVHERWRVDYTTPGWERP